MRADFFDLEEIRAIAVTRAKAIDIRFLYKAVHDRKKAKGKMDGWQANYERSKRESDPHRR